MIKLLTWLTFSPQNILNPEASDGLLLSLRGIGKIGGGGALPNKMVPPSHSITSITSNPGCATSVCDLLNT